MEMLLIVVVEVLVVILAVILCMPEGRVDGITTPISGFVRSSPLGAGLSELLPYHEVGVTSSTWSICGNVRCSPLYAEGSSLSERWCYYYYPYL